MVFKIICVCESWTKCVWSVSIHVTKCMCALKQKLCLRVVKSFIHMMLHWTSIYIYRTQLELIEFYLSFQIFFFLQKFQSLRAMPKACQKLSITIAAATRNNNCGKSCFISNYFLNARNPSKTDVSQIHFLQTKRV